MFEYFKQNKLKYAALFSSASRDAVRGELAIYFGPRADVFLNVYDKMYEKFATNNRGRFTVFTWNWPAFFLSFVWYFYRKMYLIGALVILLPIVFSLLFNATGGSGTVVAFAAYAKFMYVHTGLGRILKADKLGLTGAERDDYLRRAGGVSVTAGVLAGILYAALLGLVILSIYVGPVANH